MKTTTERRYITAAFVKGVKAGDKRRFVWDADGSGNRRGVTGLGLMVTPAGNKSWVLQYRIHGRPRRMTIGQAEGDLSPEDARKRARHYRSMIDAGVDPLDEKREQTRKAAVRRESVTTVAELCSEYMERHAKPHKRTWRADQKRIDRHVIPTLGPVAIEDVTRSQVRTLYERIGRESGPREAEHVRVLLSGMFRLAVEWELRPEGLGNPASIPKRDRFKPQRRKRRVKQDELPKLGRALSKLAVSDPHLAAFYRLLLLTGLRSSELRERRWDELDRKAQTLFIGQTKAGDPRVVPLSAAAIEALPDRIVGSPFIFPSKVTPREKPVSQNYAIKRWRELCAGAKLHDLRLHDLRHTVASSLADSGMPAQDIQQALGHQSIQTTMGYIHAADGGARKGLDALGGSVEKALDRHQH